MVNSLGEKEIIPAKFCKTPEEIFSSDAFFRCVESYIEKNLKGKGGKRLSALEYAKNSLTSDPGQGSIKILRGQEGLLALFSDKQFLDYAEKYLRGIQKFIGTKEEADEFFKTFNLQGLQSFLIKHISNNRARIILSLQDEGELKNAQKLASFAGHSLHKINGVGRVRFVLTDEGNSILDIYDFIGEKILDGAEGDKIFHAKKDDKAMYVSLTTAEPIGGVFYGVGPIKHEKDKLTGKMIKYFIAQEKPSSWANWSKKAKIIIG